MIFNKQRVWHWNVKQPGDVGYDGPSYVGGGAVSRDYAIGSIPCQVECCPCNKRGKCEMPSNIKIGPDGACKFGKVAIEMARKETQSNNPAGNGGR